MRTIVFNQSNVIQNGFNNTLIYNFPNSVDLTGAYLAVSNVYMYYSWDNINATYGNNVFSYNWITGANPPITYQVLIPDGLYELAQINEYLQFVMIANGHYLVNGAGQNVYYAELILNPTRYAVQTNTFAVPTVLPAGFTNPAGLVLPTITFNPVITYPAFFNEIVGYVAGFATPQNSGIGTTLSFLSSTAPQVQPNSNLLISVSGIDNKYSNPSSIIYSIAPAVNFGALIIEKPAEFNFNKMLSGTYNQLRLQFLTNTGGQIYIRDPNMTLILLIKDADDFLADRGATQNTRQNMEAGSNSNGNIGGQGFGRRF
jgi:hypothetical protein